MSLQLRTTVNGVAGALLAGALILGGLWLGDRARRWEEPRWIAGTFIPLRAEQRPGPDGRATWMVVINPRCSRCVTTLRLLHARWARSSRHEGLAALIVDTTVRPDTEALRTLPPMPVWWDRDGIWRRRWGHRLYGELIGFDAAGGYLRTVSGEEALRLARRLAPKDVAPVTMKQGGTRS